MTPQTTRAFLDAIRSGLTYGLAAKKARISYSCFVNWRWLASEAASRGVTNEYTQFMADVEEAEADWAIRAMGDITRGAQRSWLAAAWQLERRFPQDYGTKQSLEISGPGGGPVQVSTTEQLKDFSTEELLALDKALRKLPNANNGALAGPTIDVVPTEARSDPTPTSGSAPGSS